LIALALAIIVATVWIYLPLVALLAEINRNRLLAVGLPSDWRLSQLVGGRLDNARHDLRKGTRHT
jgi:hypothetical protein